MPHFGWAENRLGPQRAQGACEVNCVRGKHTGLGDTKRLGLVLTRHSQVAPGPGLRVSSWSCLGRLIAPQAPGAVVCGLGSS